MTAFCTTLAMTTDFTDYEPPRFEWDDWKGKALAKGLDEDLATLGREVYREAINHAWPGRLQWVCMDPMLTHFLTKSPQTARQFYEAMLATDGFQFAFEENGSGIIELLNF
ncbi:hypothetical protein ACFSSA_05990 [Luteolibacter algae]|uniref:Uncharacterized protein n=1 Tax=Luteolibacter algae TaxID=454151 RepID=A0ABW5D6M4_9BACT